MSKNNTTVKFSINAGILMSSYVENSIRNYCFMHDYDLQIEKGSGILTKTFFVKINLPEEELQDLYSFINTYLSEQD